MPRFGPGDCKICGRAPGTPYRRQGPCGTIVEGCIDDAHTGHLYGNSAQWHNRPSAKVHRAAVKRAAASCRVGRR